MIKTKITKNTYEYVDKTYQYNKRKNSSLDNNSPEASDIKVHIRKTDNELKPIYDQQDKTTPVHRNTGVQGLQNNRYENTDNSNRNSKNNSVDKILSRDNSQPKIILNKNQAKTKIIYNRSNERLNPGTQDPKTIPNSNIPSNNKSFNNRIKHLNQTDTSFENISNNQNNLDPSRREPDPKKFYTFSNKDS